MLEDGRARLEVVLEADRVDHDLRHTLGHLVDSAKIPGFRKGKVPPSVVLQRMGREEVFEETMREFLPAWVGEAIAESRLHPADRPSVDFESVPGRGRAVHVHGRVPAAADRHAAREARARGRAGGRRGSGRRGRRRARAAARGVLAARHGRARRAQTGDFVEVDMHVSAGGKPVPEASTVGYLVQLGNGRTFEEIERALRGMTAGETRTTELPLPADYPDAKLRGRNADVELHVHSVRERQPRPLDDEFARASSEFDTLAELRAAIEGSLPRAARGARPLALPLQRARPRSARPSRSTCRPTRWPAASRSCSAISRATSSARACRSGRSSRRPGAAWSRSRRRCCPRRSDRCAASSRSRRSPSASSIVVDDAELESVLREELADEEDVDAAVQEVLASRAKEAARDELRLQRALDRACEIATPITAEQQAAREQLWTPGDDEKAEPAVAKPTIWTPGQPR